MVGGTTYEEARAVTMLNTQLAQQAAAPGPSGQTGPAGGTRILLGGTGVLNSKTCVRSSQLG